MVLLRGRGGPLVEQRVALLTEAGARDWAVREVLDVGRTHRGVLRALELARAGVIQHVAVASIAALARTEALQLAVVAELATLGVTVLSTQEPWISESPSTLAHVAAWLLERDRGRRAAQVRTSLSRARAEGVRIGRPRRDIPPNALELVLAVGMGKAARQLGIGESTLRRFVNAQRSQRLWLPLASVTSPVATPTPGGAP